MTVIRPNSVSGINSITAQANEIKIFKSDGTQGGLVIGGANLNATSGISTVAALTVTGNVSVGGTLTYQDVTNVDSIGVVTARNGIDVTGGTVTITTGANSASPAGSGDNLVIKDSNGCGLSILSGNGNSQNIYLGSVSDNDVVRLEGFYNSGSPYFNIYTAGSERLRINSAGEVYIGSSTANGQGKLFVNDSSGTTTTRVHIRNAVATGNAETYYNLDGTKFASVGLENGSLVFRNSTSSTPTERLRIDSSGRVMLGTTTPGPTAGEQLTIADSANAGITIRSGTTAAGSILFEDDTADRGEIQYSHNGDYMRFKTAGSERLRITSAGFVGINEASPSTHLHVEQDNAHSGTYYLNSDAAILVDNKNASGKAVIKLEHDAAIVWGGSGSSILFSDREAERLRINEYGNTIFQGQAGSFGNGNSGNAAILVRGKSVSGSSTTVDLNISQATSASGIGLEIQESTNTANALATLVFNHGSLKSMIACSRVVTNNWGTDLRFYTHDDSTTGANQHKVYERMRIDSSGRLGINDTSPSSYLTVNRATSDGVLSIFKNDEVSIQIGVWGTGSSYARECTINSTRQDGGTYPWLRLAGQDGIRFASDLNNVRGNLNAYGEWRIGVGNDNLISTDQSHTIGNIGVWNTTNAARLQMQERTSNWISFKDGGGTHYGTISRNGSGVSYGSNSDYRLKDNVQNFTSGIELVKRLRPVTFNWNALSGQEDTTTIHRGFLAHEVQEIEPGAVDGEKDGMDRVGDCTNAEGVVTQKNVYESQAKDGETWTLVSEEIKDQQLDPAKLVPILTAGLKEAIAKIETLEAAVAALQGS